MLAWIGVEDASRDNVERILRQDGVIGISTGGVAEVFETDAEMDGIGDECVVLKSRKGLVKLALRTGSDIVPCYLFGNTKLLSCFTGGPFKGPLRAFSRAIGFATILFWGRYLLPVPYRVPIMGVLTKPIKIKQVDDPTQAQIDAVHTELLSRMKDMFETYKHMYGWSEKTLVIK
jgi:2-acylglycerol O-acyltransferase 2